MKLWFYWHVFNLFKEEEPWYHFYHNSFRLRLRLVMWCKFDNITHYIVRIGWSGIWELMGDGRTQSERERKKERVKKKEDPRQKKEQAWGKRKWNRIFKFNGDIKRKHCLLLVILMLLQCSVACSLHCLCSPPQPFIVHTDHSESKFGGDDCPYNKAKPVDVALSADKPCLSCLMGA